MFLAAWRLSSSEPLVLASLSRKLEEENGFRRRTSRREDRALIFGAHSSGLIARCLALFIGPDGDAGGEQPGAWSASRGSLRRSACSICRESPCDVPDQRGYHAVSFVVMDDLGAALDHSLGLPCPLIRNEAEKGDAMSDDCDRTDWWERLSPAPIGATVTPASEYGSSNLVRRSHLLFNESAATCPILIRSLRADEALAEDERILGLLFSLRSFADSNSALLR